MTLADEVAIGYVLRDRYLAPRRLLVALGMEGTDVLDDVIEAQHTGAAGPEPAATDPEARARQIEAFMQAVS